MMRGPTEAAIAAGIAGRAGASVVSKTHPAIARRVTGRRGAMATGALTDGVTKIAVEDAPAAVEQEPVYNLVEGILI